MNLSKFDTLGSWKPKSSWTINGTRRKRSMLLTWEKELSFNCNGGAPPPSVQLSCGGGVAAVASQEGKGSILTNFCIHRSRFRVLFNPQLFSPGSATGNSSIAQTESSRILEYHR
ncbi:hypothetical protein M9H77_33994 [Catharanthus roseus]|uniref:Uncharacterized protein n=1 Tax=Catharanthus roseus TaxID=4058 RepID=A0ACB9ZK31_CATRO|nr:hypothetical protein M9H77_33994 [Catharanthus roseus]